jgi:hypothetical protein
MKKGSNVLFFLVKFHINLLILSVHIVILVDRRGVSAPQVLFKHYLSTPYIDATSISLTLFVIKISVLF